MSPTDPAWPPYVPVIVVFPTATAVTVPPDDTVATPALLELHVGVTVPLVPSLYVAVAVTVAVAPTASVIADAFNTTLVTVAAVTVSPTDPLWPPYVPVIVVFPTATAVTVPTDDTVATPALLELHVGVIVALVPSLYVAVAVTVAVAPTTSAVADALTEISVTVASAVTTVMSTESLCPS